MENIIDSVTKDKTKTTTTKTPATKTVAHEGVSTDNQIIIHTDTGGL